MIPLADPLSYQHMDVGIWEYLSSGWRSRENKRIVRLPVHVRVPVSRAVPPRAGDLGGSDRQFAHFYVTFVSVERMR